MDYSTLGSLLPRYFRLVGDGDQAASEYEVEGIAAKKVPWMPNFCCIPGCLPIRGSTTSDYKKCGLYPMDVASSLPIVLLNVPVDRKIKILDVCCCPGSKLQMVADRCTCDSLVVGVDIAKQRLEVCMSLQRSWDEQQRACSTKKQCRKLLFHGDGSIFGSGHTGNLLFDSDLIDEDVALVGKARKRNKSYRDRESKRLKALETSMQGPSNPHSASSSITLDSFDYVLVDAECTHDASYKHMKFIDLPKTSTENTATLSKPTAELSHDRISTLDSHASQLSGSEQLRDLQRGLLSNGYANLKIGGELVYSTCSKERAQNEDIVRWLLDSVPTAQLVHAVDTLRELLPAGITLRTAPEESIADTTNTASTAVNSSTAPQQTAPPASSSLLTAEEVLQLNLPQLSAYLSAHCNTTSDSSALRELSIAIWEWAAAQPRPVVFESAILPGTVRLSYQGAMSGHFIAKIRKLA